jgi:hypothetical protein
MGCEDALTYVLASDNHIETKSEQVQTHVLRMLYGRFKPSIQELSTTKRFNSRVE